MQLPKDDEAGAVEWQQGFKVCKQRTQSFTKFVILG